MNDSHDSECCYKLMIYFGKHCNTQYSFLVMMIMIQSSQHSHHNTIELETLMIGDSLRPGKPRQIYFGIMFYEWDADVVDRWQHRMSGWWLVSVSDLLIIAPDLGSVSPELGWWWVTTERCPPWCWPHRILITSTTENHRNKQPCQLCQLCQLLPLQYPTDYNNPPWEKRILTGRHSATGFMYYNEADIDLKTTSLQAKSLGVMVWDR